MKIKLVKEFNGLAIGSEFEPVNDDVARLLIKRGIAKEVEAEPKKARKRTQFEERLEGWVTSRK